MAQTTSVRDRSGIDRLGPATGHGHRVVTVNNDRIVGTV